MMVKRRREGKWERVIYTRYADDMVVLVYEVSPMAAACCR